MAKDEIFLDEEDFIVEMTDEEGNKYYYIEEMIIPVDNEKYALLVAVDPDGEELHCEDPDCDCGDSDDVIIAKIVVNADGEEEYIEPTDEEFEKVQAAYEQMMDEEL